MDFHLVGTWLPREVHLG